MEEDVRFMTCRLCLSVDFNNLINIFDSKEITEYKPADVITELLRHEVSAGDKYPQSVCTECLKTLNEFMRFKEKCDSCKELLERAHAAKIFSSMVTAHRESAGHYGNCHFSGNIDANESLSPVDNDPLAESDVEPDEIVDSKPFVERINRIAVEEVLPDITQVEPDEVEDRKPVIGNIIGVEGEVILSDIKRSPGHNENSHFSGNIDINESLSPVGNDPLAESEVEPDEIVDRKPFNERMKSIMVEEVLPDITQEGSKENQFAGDSDDENLFCYSEWEEEKVDDDLHESSLGKGDENTESSDSECSTDPFGDGTTVVKKRFKCPKCKKQYNHYISYKDHLNEHLHGRRHVCKVCGKEYLTKGRLVSHMQSHSGEVKCAVCGKEYKNLMALRMHMEYHEEKKHECKQCGKKFHKKGSLKIHEWVHTDLRTHECDVCFKRFKRKADLKSHMVTHNGGNVKKHSCPKCERMFCSKTALESHLRKHEGLKPFSCDQCDKCFRDKSTLVRHVKYSHSDQKTMFQCDECRREYPRKHTLERHKNDCHKGIKAFKCTHCGQAFTQKHNLTNHIKRKHSE